MTGPSSNRAGLYIHVPFCTSVCPYCDFAVTIAGADRQRAWADALISEAARQTHLDLEFDTVYFGGGTPSSLDADLLDRTLERLGQTLRIRTDALRYLEINPEDVTVDSALRWRELGFDVVSLGVQSFDDRALRLLGRSHTADEARTAAVLLIDAGFQTVSLDLIFGIDGRSAEDWRADLEAAAALDIDHLSCYQLTFHHGTVFGRRLEEGLLAELVEPHQAELFLLTHEILSDSGFDGYEVSNFASSEKHRSQHNLKYWNHTPYLGLGPSAHSFSEGRRWWNLRKVRLWQSALDRGDSPVAGEENPSSAQFVLERLLLGLRTTDGIDLGALELAYGIDLRRRNEDAINRLSESGHILVEGSRIRPTVEGLAIADTLARSIEIPDDPTDCRGSP